MHLVLVRFFRNDAFSFYLHDVSTSQRFPDPCHTALRGLSLRSASPNLPVLRPPTPSGHLPVFFSLIPVRVFIVKPPVLISLPE